MKIVTPRRKKTTLITVISVALLLITAGAVYYFIYYRSLTPSSQEKRDESFSPKSSDQAPTETNPSEQASPQREVEKPKVQTHEGGAATNGLTGVINYKGVAGGDLIIRVTIDQSISGGQCLLKLTKGDKAIQRTTGIAQNPSSTTCQGFNVPVSELESGVWAIIITVTSGNQTTNITDNITI